MRRSSRALQISAEQRLQAYRQGGVAAIAPYARTGGAEVVLA